MRFNPQKNHKAHRGQRHGRHALEGAGRARLVDGHVQPARGREAASALSRFAESSPAPFIDGIRAARKKIVAQSDEDRQNFLRKRGFSKAETGRIVETVLVEEGRPPESVFDFVQGITAVARSKPQQDVRLMMEGKAKGLLERLV